MNRPEIPSSLYRNQAASRVLAVLSAFIGESEPKGVSELARALGFNKNLVHRALTALTEAGYLTRDASGERYQLGYRLLGLASGGGGEFDVVAFCRPFLEQLNRLTAESVYLSIVVGGNRVTVDDIQAQGPRVLRSQRGHPVPLHCTKMSRVLLAHLSDADITRYLAAAAPLARAGNIPHSRRALRALAQSVSCACGLCNFSDFRCRGPPARDRHHRRSARTLRSAPNRASAARHARDTGAARAPGAIVRSVRLPGRAMSSSAKRALHILDMIGHSDRPLGLSEIARGVQSPPATAFRALDALTRAGLVARYQASSRYVLGHTAERLRQSVIARFPMRDVCLPYLRQLASASGETASLNVRLGWYAVRIATVPGAGEIAHLPSLGEAVALGDSYRGRAMLAFLADQEAARYRNWAGTRRAPVPAAARLAAIRRSGFAAGDTDFGGGRPLAFSIRGAHGVLASLAVEGPVLRDGAPEDAAPRDGRAIAAAIEALARTKPALFENPFAHIDPDTVAL
jgi:DNA-binding IclR family transcriptional regulator